MRVLCYLHARGIADRWVRIGPTELALRLNLNYRTAASALAQLRALRVLAAQGTPRRREYHARLDSE